VLLANPLEIALTTWAMLPRRFGPTSLLRPIGTQLLTSGWTGSRHAGVRMESCVLDVASEWPYSLLKASPRPVIM